MIYCLLLIPIIGGPIAIVLAANGWLDVYSLAIFVTMATLLVAMSLFAVFDTHSNQFQFVEDGSYTSPYQFFLGGDGLSIYFLLLTGFIFPLAILSNFESILEKIQEYVVIVIGLELLLLTVFLVLDAMLFYVFFESILPPLFIVIGLYGSANKIKASFYLFLYTLLGSLFLLLAILGYYSVSNTTDFDTLFKITIIASTQLWLFYGIFAAIAVKTPVIFLNNWLLKAHVESPLGVSIILAAIVLKLSLYCIVRLILPILTEAYLALTYMVFSIGVLTIMYASVSTMRTIDLKELIAYSSVSHAAVYLLGVFSNCLQGIEGAICLGLAHGLVSPGLFICGGGVLYDRVRTRLIAFYRGLAQTMPVFAILFFILCLANCGAPLTLNFIGEFLSLYGVFERSMLFGVLASSSIIFSAAYTMFMYQRIALGGSSSGMVTVNLPDLNKREFTLLLTVIIPTIFLGIYPAPILDGIHYSVSTLLCSFDLNVISCDAPNGWGDCFTKSTSYWTLFKNVFLALSLLLIFKYYNFIKKYLTEWVIYLSEKKYEIYILYLFAIAVFQLFYLICSIADLTLLSKLFMFNYVEFVEFTGHNTIAYLGPNDHGCDGCGEHPNHYDGTVHRSSSNHNTNGATTNGATTNGATTNGATTNGATTNGATTNGATTNGATTNGATTNGATTNGATTNGATTNGATQEGIVVNGVRYTGFRDRDHVLRFLCAERGGEPHVWEEEFNSISNRIRCYYNVSHSARRDGSYYYCVYCGVRSCTNCI